VLGACLRPDLEICLEQCRITGAAAKALVEVLGRNQGPTKLVLCNINSFFLTDGLRGNSPLRSWRACISGNLEVGNRQVLAIASALRQNKGLIEMNWYGVSVNDETWHTICD
jgi:hypothetical protein